MLLNVHVKNLALIEDVDVYFDEGFNILTGETGAGKSIILGSINMALGQKAPKEIVRDGAEFGLVELIFEIKEEDVLQELKNQEVFPDENGQIIITRRIVNGRSVIKVNGESFSANDLKNIASLLINIHGQHDNETLLHKAKHMEILDEYGGSELLDKKKTVAALYAEYKLLKEKMAEFDIDDDKRQREIDLCRYEVEEIEEAGLIDGEDEELEDSFKLMSNAMKLLSAMNEIQGQVGSDGALGAIGYAAKAMNSIVNYDEKLTPFYDTIMDLEAICSDLERDLVDYIEKLSFDEEEIHETSERLDLINRLKTKYGNSIEKITKYCEEVAEKLSVLENFEEEKNKLGIELESKKKQYIEAAKQLSDIRREKAEVFEKAIIEALTELNFMDVRFKVDMATTEDMSPKGMDSIEFLISTNVGENIKPLANVASGGELSRIMLGLKSIMADRDDIGTMIFDEIDAGISGRTAQKVSEKLKKLSKKHQIICITHLPQIASMSDTHFLIEKCVKNGKTVTEISKLNEEASVDELARMLGGAEITESVLANAQEMKANAKKF